MMKDVQGKSSKTTYRFELIAKFFRLTMVNNCIGNTASSFSLMFRVCNFLSVKMISGNSFFFSEYVKEPIF